MGYLETHRQLSLELIAAVICRITTMLFQPNHRFWSIEQA